MVYIFDDLQAFTDEDYEKYIVLLSRQRIEKSEKYVRKSDRIVSILAFLLLRYALYHEYNETKMPLFSFGIGNKPYMENINVKFNLSHCNKAVMCGLDNWEIGVDIQDYQLYEDDMADIVLSEKEKTEIKADSSILRFTEIWTLKECYGKVHGNGIIYELKETCFSGIKDLWTERYGYMFYCEQRTLYAFSVCTHQVKEIKNVSYADLCKVLDFLVIQEFKIESIMGS